MNWIDIVILAAAVLVVAGAVGFAVYRRKRGKGGCGSCSDCPYAHSCAEHHPDNKEE